MYSIQCSVINVFHDLYDFKYRLHKFDKKKKNEIKIVFTNKNIFIIKMCKNVKTYSGTYFIFLFLRAKFLISNTKSVNWISFTHKNSLTSV